jgi:glycosyltransferase involved in cell wall biosynthesis
MEVAGQLETISPERGQLRSLRPQEPSHCGTVLNVAAVEHITVVIPVYNQPDCLRDVVSRCLAEHRPILIVDDGSEPPVAPMLEGLPVELIRHNVNRGKGQALRTAERHLLQRGDTHMITLDADGQHYPEDLPRFLEAIERHPEAMVVGVRDFNQAAVPGASRFGRAFGNFWVRVQTGTRVWDIQSGFRAYPLSVLGHLPCRAQAYAFEVEIVVRALWGGVKVHEVPVRVHYPKPEQRVSHFNKFYDNLRLGILNTHLTVRALVPWPHHQVVAPDAEASVTMWHPLRSIRMLLTERATPRELGFAVALGVFLGAVPLIALHTLAILIAAALLRLNRVAAVAASQLCMPPVVPALCIEAGYFMRHGSFLTLKGVKHLSNASFLELGYMGLERLWEWLLGSLLVGPALALVLGLRTYIAARIIERAWHEH